MVADQDFGTCPKCGGDYIGSAEAARRQAAADRMTAEEAAQAKAEAEAERKFYEDQKKDKKSNIFLYIPFWGGLTGVGLYLMLTIKCSGADYAIGWGCTVISFICFITVLWTGFGKYK